MQVYDQARADDDARIVEHLGLVKRVALHLQSRVPRFIELDDLMQAGMIGLIEAARSYDPDKGVNFENFAYVRVKGAMFDEVRKISYLPRSAVAINKAHAQSESELAAKIGAESAPRAL